MMNAEFEDLDQNLIALVARQADCHPEAEAVIDDTGATTYRELVNRAQGIADTLSRDGLHPEQAVGVLMNRTSDLVATLLGIFAAGGCYVPLDPDDHPERTRRIIEGSQCKLILGHRTLLTRLEAHLQDSNHKDDPVELGEIENYVNTSEAADFPAAPGGHQLAYVLFTSGSTGKPKGVEVEHRSVVNMLCAMRDLFEFTESDRYLATSTIGFDISVAELFLPLITGGVVVLQERQLVLAPHRLVDVIRKYGVTVFQTGPSVWSVLLDEVPEFPRLRVAVSTGEAIPPDLARRVAGVGDTAWNLYGPTEATVWTTAHRMEGDASGIPARSSVSEPIGRPLANVAVRVLDEHRVPVKHGNEGELWIGGEALARGYRNNEALTRERFVDLGEESGIFYQTGDVVVEDRDGTLHYFGRNDDQIKVRGVRIEPMEVESVILSCPEVLHAAATWFSTASGSRSIVAAVVLRPGHSLSAEELHIFMEPQLPSAMVPSRFVFCDALPLSPSGKVDRKAIRSRATDNPADSTPTAQGDAETETEATLIGIWERTLNLRPVSRSDHFFTIGGDSLSAVSMMLEIEAAFEISLTVRYVFESPTLDQLTKKIDQIRAEQLGVSASPEEVQGLGNSAFVFPLSQQGCGNPVYFNAVDLKMARKGFWNIDCPLYSVSHWAQGKGFTTAKSIEDLARIQIEEIRSIQPKGPYRLAGYSFGGMIALEIAQQMRRSGEVIELLFLLDPSEPFTRGYLKNLPNQGSQVSSAPESTGGRIKRHVRQIITKPLNALQYVGTRAFAHTRGAVVSWIAYHLVHLYGKHQNPISTRLLPRDRWPAFWYTAKRLGKTYHPRPYEGRVLAVFADQSRGEIWQSLLGPAAEIRSIDTNHTEMFVEPALSLWLKSLQTHIDENPDS